MQHLENSIKIVENNVDPEVTLLTYLRKNLKLCGTKLGCAEGGCGACTVMVSKFNRQTDSVSHYTVNACLAPVCSMHGLAVTTVEGIGSTKTRLHPVQERIAKAHGSQCGFCTPGFVMSMYTLLRNSPTPSMEDLEVNFQGNLCRCTGYRPIIEGYSTFTKEFADGVCGMGKDCCRNGNEVDCKDTSLFKTSEFAPLDVSQEPIFPPELKLSDELDALSLRFGGPNVTWYRPCTLMEALSLRKQHKDAKIVVGNTEVGIEVKFKDKLYPTIIFANHIPELTAIEETKEGLKVGASVTLSDLEAALKQQMSKLPEEETRLYASVVKMLKYFGGKQIRNVASVGGNIATGSPISDLNPIFTATGCLLEVASSDRDSRTIVMGPGFFTGYRQTLIAADEVLVSIELPKTNKDRYVLAYKQAKRRDDDIAIVNVCFDVMFRPGSDVVDRASVVYGGMAATTVVAHRSQELLQGKRWTSEMLEPVYSALVEDLPIEPGAPGGVTTYRQSLSLSLFFKAYLKISELLQSVVPGRLEIPEKYKSGADTFKTYLPKGTQFFELNTAEDPVGRPNAHASGLKHAAGEAVYCDDIPRFENELYMAVVLSTKAHAHIINIDASAALAMPGVHAFFSAKDIECDLNKAGIILNDEEMFVSKTVTSQGQMLGVVIADDQGIAKRAARKVKVTYGESLPFILTIEDAIKRKSFFNGYPKTIIKGDVESALRDAAHVIESKMHIGGQEHFYMETHAAIAVPKEDDEMEIFCSVQSPEGVQRLVSNMLGVPRNRVTIRVKRVGGGFGGKDARGFTLPLPVAFAASKLRCPVRCMFDRDEDMIITGARHPFLCKYKVGITAEGKILGCYMELYSNGGYSADLSFPVMERGMMHFENSYFIPNVHVTGYVCKTNIYSNTAFRGFGLPQTMLTAEQIIREIAHVLKKDYTDIARMNLFVDGNITHYNQTMVDVTLTRCWDECMQSSDFRRRRKEVDEFNILNRWRKRGISIVATKFGIGFEEVFMNQAGALVHVYADGSVLLTHGGTEMGQGLHTKMLQVASRVLSVPVDIMHISETSTDKVPNAQPTAASSSSDLNGMAVMNACTIIVERLQPYKDANPSGTWKAWVGAAYMDRVSLSSTGFFKTPDLLQYDYNTNNGTKLCNYFTYGVGVSEVEIDCLTGDHKVLRTDIVMDVGNSLNPAIDIGQIEGGFIQGYGMYTMEELIFSPYGELLSRGPGAYKLPTMSDIPVEFNVSLLKGSSNPRAVYSSKAIGEPPLFLSSSVLFAIKEAISAARAETGCDVNFRLDSPATAARIRMACSDNFTEKFPEPEPSSYIPWNVVI